ncbi:MAG: EpsG family protein [Clostridia bacterium]|nr:EpsG family protein [Clostridia bacterium]
MTIVVTLLTLLAPLAMLPVNAALCSKHKKYIWLYCGLIALGLAAIGYNYAPFSWENADLNRHFLYMERVQQSGMTWQEASETKIFEGLPIYFVLIKIFSFFSEPQLLPAFTTFVGYFICLYIVFKLDSSNDINITFLTLFVVLSCIYFLGFSSGIRQYLAFTFFLIAFYFESVEEKYKKTAWVVYFAITGLHTTGVILIALRLAGEVLYRAKNKTIPIMLVLIWSVFQNMIVDMLGSLFGGNVVIDKLVELAGHYSEHGSKVIWPFYVWRMFFAIICLIAVIVIIKTRNDDDKVTERYLYFSLTVLLFTFGGLTSYDVFARFSAFSFMLVLPLISIYLKKIPKESRGIFIFGLTAAGVLVLFVNFWGYSQTHFNNLLDMLFTNIFTFIRGIIG